MDYDIYSTYNGQPVYDDVNYTSFQEFERRHPQPPVPPSTPARPAQPLGPFELLAQRQSHNRRCLYESGQGGESLRDARLYHTFTNITAYRSLEEVFTEWPNLNGGTVEVKYLKPATQAEWSAVIYCCTTLAKVFKTLGSLLAAPSAEYKFHCQSKLFLRPTTYQISYEPANYLLTVKTGQAARVLDGQNWGFALYSLAVGELHALLRTMRYDLPPAQFAQAYDLYVLIKDKQTAFPAK